MNKENIIGYVIVYFDYSVIDQMFSVNLPKNSYFEVINDQGTEIYANRDRKISVKNRAYVSNTFYAKNVGWTFKMSIPSEYYISGIQKTMILTWNGNYNDYRSGSFNSDIFCDKAYRGNYCFTK